MSIGAVVEAFHQLGIWLPGSKHVYLDFICLLWIFDLCFSAKALLGIGFFGGFFCHTVKEEGIGFESLGDFPYFHQGFIDSCLSCIGVE